jgi:subtilisin family serine protease|tara:strand:- start:2155 stop:4194 length:2040 start_codon:yes stop_codon:yes gene_type:complete
MEEKVYIVTLHKHEDLEKFYNEMSDYHLVMKRPMSRNTHYKMTEEQAEILRQDPRVWDVQLPPAERGMKMFRDVLNYTPYNISGDFWKNIFTGTINTNDRQWGHVHCAGDTAQRGKTIFGRDGINLLTEIVDVFNDGKHVDVVICDDPVSSDCSEWFSPTTGLSRFVEYDWYSNLNSLVSTIDDDGETIPTGSYPNYVNNATNTESHGVHVAGTVAGQHYGWAREANIYSMQVLSNTSNQGTPVPDLLIFDYLRAFHRNKTVNPDTGMKNPTITNHSWSYGYPLDDILEKPSLDLSDITQVIYRGTTYNSSNPNPSGWTWAGLETDFGFAPDKMRLNSDYAAVRADIEDAIKEGVVVIGSAGNNNFHMVADGDPDYDNRVGVVGLGTVFYNRGSTPANSLNAINVGSLSSYVNFRRSTYSNFGPLVDIFAPGDNIISAYNSSGTSDGKYGGSNYYQAISGTSMASPQVTGVIACLASYKPRFNQSDARAYLDQFSFYNDMTWDTNGGLFDDNTCQKGSPDKYLIAKNPRQDVTGMISNQVSYRNTADGGLTFPRSPMFHRAAPAATPKTFTLQVTNIGASSYVFNGNDRLTNHVDASDPVLNFNVKDTIIFQFSISGSHPFWIKTTQTTGTSNGVTTGTITNNGQQSSNLTWDTDGVTPGTYYYICRFHGGMSNQIIIS